jgi:hypothetical protein
VSQQKTIDEVAREVEAQHWRGNSDNYRSIAKAGIIAGLQMAAEVCDEQEIQWAKYYKSTCDPHDDGMSDGCGACGRAILALKGGGE